MDTTSPFLFVCLLALSLAAPRTGKWNLTSAASSTSTPTPTTTPALNLTHITTVAATAVTDSADNTTAFNSSTDSYTTFTEDANATTASTSQPQASSTTTNSTTHTPTFTALTANTTQTAVTDSSAPNTTVLPTDTTVFPTAISSATVNRTSDSQVLGLNASEKGITIFFSIVLGLFGVALVLLMYNRCKEKIQYFHQPLNDTEETDHFVPDDDTLIISGGLYDGHPMSDSPLAATREQPQFRLEFLHED